MRSQVTELASIFEAKILDVGYEAMTIMVAGAPEKLDAMTDLLAPFGIVELQRTGRIALAKLSRESSKLELVKNKGAWPPARPSRRPLHEREPMPATISYDDDADLGLLERQEGRGPRLRLAGPRARAEPEGLGRRRASSGCAKGSSSTAKAEEAGLAVLPTGEACRRPTS